MIIAVDFDGTMVEHRYPDIGADVPGAFEWCARLQSEAHARLILWTMRDGAELEQAVEHSRARGVQWWGINANPQQRTWTTSPKVYAHLYIDDAAAGCPLVLPTVPGRRAFVDWSVVGPAALALARP